MEVLICLVICKSYIHGYGTYVGGLIGYKDNSNHKNENCYSQSVIDMTSATAIGGFIGQDQCTQSSGNKYYSNCYANTVMLGAGTNKGFCGERVSGCTSTQSGCVWNKN